MQLLILRHADASTSARTDDLRPLSDKGRQQAKRVARFCSENGLQPDIILTSPYLRAEETAKIVAEELQCEWVLNAFLASGMMPFAAMEEMRAFLRFGCVMIVGHEPDLSAFAGTLLGAGHLGALRMRKATLAGLEVDSMTSGGAHLEFLVPAKMMGKE